MDVDTLIRFINGVGMPGALLVGLLLGIWRLLVLITPAARVLAQKHVELIDTLKEGTAKLTESVQAIESSTSSNGRRLSDVIVTIDGHSQVVSHAADAIEELATDEQRERIRQHTARMREAVAKSNAVRDELRKR